MVDFSHTHHFSLLCCDVLIWLDTKTSNAQPSGSDDALRDSWPPPAVGDGEIIPDFVANEVTEQDSSPKVVTSSDGGGPPEPRSSLIDAQPKIEFLGLLEVMSQGRYILYHKLPL